MRAAWGPHPAHGAAANGSLPATLWVGLGLMGSFGVKGGVWLFSVGARGCHAP